MNCKGQLVGDIVTVYHDTLLSARAELSISKQVVHTVVSVLRRVMFKATFGHRKLKVVYLSAFN